MSCPDERGLEEKKRRKENGKGLGERGDRENRGERRALPAAGQGSAVGVQGRAMRTPCPAQNEPARLHGRGSLGDGDGHAVSEVQDPGQSRAAGPGHPLDRGGRVECGQPGQGCGGKVAGRRSGTQGDKTSTRASRNQRGRAGEPEGRLGPGQRRERGSQGVAASPSEQQWAPASSSAES